MSARRRPLSAFVSVLVPAVLVAVVLGVPGVALADDEGGAATSTSTTVTAQPTVDVPTDVSATSTTPTTPTTPSTPTQPATPTETPAPSAEEPDPTVPTVDGEPVQAGDVVVGELVQAFAEPGPQAAGATDDQASDAPLSWVQTDSGDAVRVPTEDVDDLPVGATVSVTLGDQVPDATAAAEGLEPATDVVAAAVVAPADPTAQTTAETVAPVNHLVTVAMVIPAGATRDGTTLAQVQAAVNGPVATFWEQQSAGVVRLGTTGPGVDWFQSSSSCSNPTGLWNDAAARAGFVPGNGRHLLVYVPYGAPGCSYGLAQVGQSGTNGGGMLYVEATATSVIAHEFGHNFGLGHSSELQCPRAIEGSGCQITSYRDYYDVMGVSWSQVGTLSALNQAQLGVLPTGQRVDVTPSAPAATVTLSPISTTSGTRAARLAASDGSVYWLEYRPSAGQDGWLSTPSNWVGVQPGVLLRRQNGTGGDSSLLLDPTPSAAADYTGDVLQTFPPGTPVSVARGDFTITVIASSGSGTTVRIGTAASPSPVLPRGNWEGLSVSGASVTAVGWAYDPDQATAATPIRLDIDGVSTTVTADLSRPDVGAAFPGVGNAHGFSATSTLAPGVHTVCVTALDNEVTGLGAAFGCRTVTVQLNLPTANWEVATVSGSTLSLAGWAFDPDHGTTPVQVHAYVDGGGRVLVADQSRPDVGQAFAGVGPAHGFSTSFGLAPGAHSVCLYAIDLDIPSRNLPLGCRTVTVRATAPMANWEVASTSGRSITVSGWALDPDQPSTSSAVHAYVDGGGTPLTAANSRPDVGAAFPGAGSAHGFSWTTQVAPGAHTVCLYAIDVDFSWVNTPLGCRTVQVAMALPIGNWETLSVSGSTLTVAGWAQDGDQPTTSVPVHVYVDGGGTALVANGSRPDVAAALPGAGAAHGFSFTVGVSAGTHTVCVYAIDPDVPTRNTPFGCRVVVS